MDPQFAIFLCGLPLKHPHWETLLYPYLFSLGMFILSSLFILLKSLQLPYFFFLSSLYHLFLLLLLSFLYSNFPSFFFPLSLLLCSLFHLHFLWQYFFLTLPFFIPSFAFVYHLHFASFFFLLPFIIFSPFVSFAFLKICLHVPTFYYSTLN